MSTQDIMMWQDGFWCFREELGGDFGRDSGYRILHDGSAEWLAITDESAYTDVPISQAAS